VYRQEINTVTIERTHIDHLYDWIEIDTDTFELLQKRSLAQEINRIKEIGHLGMIQKIYPLSKHSKFEHALGTHYLACLAGEHIKSQITKAGIQLHKMKMAALFHDIGHLPFTYTTEKAICNLYKLSKEIKDKIDNITKQICNTLEITGRKKTEHLKFLKKENYFELHRWFGAYKILNNEEFPEDCKKEVARYIVDKRCSGYNLLYFLDKIDYTMRDSYYINLFPFKINLIPFLKKIQISSEGKIDPPEDMNMVSGYYDLLKEKVYKNPKVMALENLFSREIVKLFKEKKRNKDFIEYLLQTNDTKLYNHLKDINLDFNKTISRVKKENITDVYSTLLLSDKESPIELEKKIVHHNKELTVIEYPKEENYFVDVEAFKKDNIFSKLGKNTFNFHCFWFEESEEPKYVLRVIAETQNDILSSPREPKELVASFVFGYRVKPDYTRLEGYIRDDIANFLEKKIGTPPHEELGKILEDSLNLRDIVGYLYKGEEHVEKFIKLVTEKENLNGILKNFLIDRLIKKPEEIKKDFLNNLYEYLDGIKAKEEHKKILLEYKAYLSKITKNKALNATIWTLPSTKIIEERTNEPIREIDVLTIEFKDIHNKPILHLEEVSISDSSTKKTKTRKKFGHLTKIVEKRFPHKFKFEYYFNGERISLD